MIVAILAKSGNLDEVRLLLIAIANGVAIKFNPKLTAYFRQYFVCTRRFFDTERFTSMEQLTLLKLKYC